MNNKLEEIGIDHGWSMMKTISQVFVTGVKEMTAFIFSLLQQLLRNLKEEVLQRQRYGYGLDLPSLQLYGHLSAT